MNIMMISSQLSPLEKQKEGSPTAIVIGSGFGGLAAAIRLQAQGVSTTILERQSQIGGRAVSFNINGITFDAGPTVITAPFVFEELFRTAGKKMEDYVKLLPVYPYYRVLFDDGSSFDYGEPEDNVKQILEFSKKDAENYPKMLEHVEKIYFKGFEELAFTPFLSLRSMLKIVPDMIKLQSYRSNYGLISKYIKNEKLRQVFSFHPLLIGGNPFSVPSIYSLIQFLEKEYGVWFAQGGTNSLVSALAKIFEEMGGKILLNQGVEKIEVIDGEARGVVTNTGKMEADVIVSNADVATTYTKLIDSKWRKKNSNKRYEKAKYSMGLFLIYFATKKLYPDMKHHTIILGPRYKELLEDIFKKKILADDFSAYLHVPTRTDRTLAPEGVEAFYILIPVPNLDANIDWEVEGSKFKDRVMDFLEENYLSGLNENLVATKILTPKDFEKNYLAYKGTGFSLEPTLRQSAYFRPHNRSEDIKKLYFVGAGTHPGAGLPGVVASAKITTDIIVEDLKAEG